MAPASKRTYNGVFIPTEGTSTGHLVVAGENTSLKLVSKDRLIGAGPNVDQVHGILDDGSKASLLGCLVTKQVTHGWREGAQSELNVFPHFVLIGDAFVNTGDSVVRAITYHFDGIHELVNGFGMFGTINGDREDLENLLKRHRDRIQRVVKGASTASMPETEVGKYPSIFYFSGVHEIAQCICDLGTITLANHVSYEIGGSRGAGARNQIAVRFEFATTKTVEESVEALTMVHRFFELCLGRAEPYCWITVDVNASECSKNDDPTPPTELLWSYANKRDFKVGDSTVYGDILLDPGARKAEFAKVLSGWLNSMTTMREARGRFFTAFLAGSYSIDRIVGAANMFDLLPDSHVPSVVDLDEQTLQAVGDSRKRFAALSQSFARDSVLSALGRIGKASLRDKVCHRADLISAVDRRFSNLRLACSQAV